MKIFLYDNHRNNSLSTTNNSPKSYCSSFRQIFIAQNIPGKPFDSKNTGFTMDSLTALQGKPVQENTGNIKIVKETIDTELKCFFFILQLLF